MKLRAQHGADVRRRFMRVQGRGVHYFRAGDGPPVVLLHYSVSSARSQLPLLKRLIADHTVYAFDNPGFGDSDPLPMRNVRIADVADALAATLVALGMPRCPVYGTHTGGAVALELARRHPRRVSALIMDGVHVFSAHDTRYFLSKEYMPPFTIKGDGTHLFSTWLKTRDGTMWFPWSRRTAKTRWPPQPLVSPEMLHHGLIDRLCAGDAYRAVYAAVFKHDMRPAVSALTVPATFMTQASDPLFRYLDSLPKLKANQKIERHPRGANYLDEEARVLRSYRVRTPASAERPLRPTPGAINRRYVDLPGGQILARSTGESRRTRPLLLLHEGRASSRMFEPLMRAFGRRRPVYAPDLPDNGASDALNASWPAITDYAEAVAETLTELDLPACDIYAVGAGSAVALELLKRPGFSRARALLEAPDFYSRAFARRLLRMWTPPLAPQWDGTYLNQLWLMLRDEYAYWPWFDRSAAAAHAMDVPTDWRELHARVVEILRSLSTYHRLTAAALRYDWIAALGRARRRSITLAVMENDPRRPHAEAAAQSARIPSLLVLPSNPPEKARSILKALRGKTI